MNSHNTTLTFTFLLSLWSIMSCSKLEDETSMDTPTEQPGEQPGDNNTTTTEDTLTVAQALKATTGTWVVVKGYIVGYVDGTTMSKARFAPPTTKVNTNLIIADHIDERDYSYCLPIQIKSGTDDQIVYNLITHPELLGNSVAVGGELTSYFKVNGFKYPDFWITELTEEDFPERPEDEEPTPTPDPTPQPEPTNDTPTLDFTPQANIYGR